MAEQPQPRRTLKSPFVFRWIPSDDLRKELVPIRDAPWYPTDGRSPIDTLWWRGRDYLASTADGTWHTDWEEWFFMMCVAGESRLHVSNLILGGKYDEPEEGEYTTITVRRGDCVGLYGMAAHWCEVLTPQRGQSFFDCKSGYTTLQQPTIARADAALLAALSA